MSVIVAEPIIRNVIVSDPDGSQGRPLGGWMFRYGRTEAGTEGGCRSIGPTALTRYRRADR